MLSFGLQLYPPTVSERNIYPFACRINACGLDSFYFKAPTCNTSTTLFILHTQKKKDAQVKCKISTKKKDLWILADDDDDNDDDNNKENIEK